MVTTLNEPFWMTTDTLFEIIESIAKTLNIALNSIFKKPSEMHDIPMDFHQRLESLFLAKKQDVVVAVSKV